MSSKVRRIIRLQVVVTVLISLPLLLLYGATVAASAFIGGAIGFITSLVYAWKMAAPQGSDPNVLLRAHFAAEGYKFGVTVALFTAAFVLFKGVAALPLFLTYAATLLVYWVALVLD